ncbi:MAG TPA: hypothetical protein VGV61_16500, partial [Thermoanaerobaculia bacterium]|nr:hypothetical protein [Thermoanaerobaculia bacterium]
MGRAKKERRQRRVAPAPAVTPAAVAARPRVPAAVKLLLAAAVVVLLFLAVRVAAPEPWSYDEYYHLGMAREMRTHLRIDSFRWTPFSLAYDHFADGEPLFHLLLLPFARLRLESAALAGVLLGQLFLVGAFAWALWALCAPRPWWFLLALPALGTLFLQRLEMCRPHVWLIGFTVLVVALLAERRWRALAVACALFGLAHAGGWIAMPLAGLWMLAGVVSSDGPGGRGRSVRAALADGWPAIAAAAGGWLVGQLVHPEVPENFRLLAIVNFVIPFQATAAGDAALHSQLGTELAPPGAGVLIDQWPAFVPALLVLLALARGGAVRTRAALTATVAGVAFLLVGTFAIRRFFELGAPLALLALAIALRERQRAGLPPLLPAGRWLAATAILVGSLWTLATLGSYGFGRVSAPLGMARWLGEHGSPGERVFTAQWGDAAPLFYCAPQLQSLVALDPTVFYLKDPRAFADYVRVVEGRDPQPAHTIRQRFGARWVTLWRMPVFERLARQLFAASGTKIAYSDD